MCVILNYYILEKLVMQLWVTNTQVVWYKSAQCVIDAQVNLRQHTTVAGKDCIW